MGVALPGNLLQAKVLGYTDRSKGCNNAALPNKPLSNTIDAIQVSLFCKVDVNAQGALLDKLLKGPETGVFLFLT